MKNFLLFNICFAVVMIVFLFFNIFFYKRLHQDDNDRKQREKNINNVLPFEISAIDLFTKTFLPGKSINYNSKEDERVVFFMEDIKASFKGKDYFISAGDMYTIPERRSEDFLNVDNKTAKYFTFSIPADFKQSVHKKSKDIYKINHVDLKELLATSLLKNVNNVTLWLVLNKK